VETCDPPLGRNRCVEVLRGGRSAELRRRGYDGLPAYGTYGHLRAPAVLARVDALLEAGALRQTFGRFPKLVLA
jgi:ATP-dependent DNA helicase RecQ